MQSSSLACSRFVSRSGSRDDKRFCSNIGIFSYCFPFAFYISGNNLQPSKKWYFTTLTVSSLAQTQEVSWKVLTKRDISLCVIFLGRNLLIWMNYKILLWVVFLLILQIRITYLVQKSRYWCLKTSLKAIWNGVQNIGVGVGNVIFVWIVIKLVFRIFMDSSRKLKSDYDW